jgi:hypothetical protein
MTMDSTCSVFRSTCPDFGHPGGQLVIDNAGVFNIVDPPGGTSTIFRPTPRRRVSTFGFDFTGFNTGRVFL